MAIKLVIFCFTMSLIGRVTEKKVVNPITIFYILWGIILYLYSLNLYGLMRASDNTLAIMSYGLVSFAVGYYIVAILNKNLRLDNANISNSNRKDNYVISNKVLYLFLVICIAFTGIQAINNARYFLSEGFGFLNTVRMNVTSNTENGLMNVIGNTIINPFLMALQPIVACNFLLGDRNKKLFIGDAVLLLLKTIADGSRIYILYIIFHFIVIYIISHGKQDKNNTRNKQLIRWVGIVGLLLLILTTFSRVNTGLTKTSYFYFSMEPYMFDIWSNQVNNSGLIGYGLASTNGFSLFIFYLLHNLGLMPNYPQFWNSINLMLKRILTEWQMISTGKTMANAYVSFFWYFYLDGRIFGVVFGSFIYGSILNRAYMKAFKNNTIRNLCIYSLLAQGLLMTFVRFPFADLTYAMAFLMILFFTRGWKR